MSDHIQLLPDSVANQIAAGEVIQRPASVIKELVENAVDAGATEINVLVVDAGRTSIQVIDNGCGMSETDARLSFERHATSKIRRAEDLLIFTQWVSVARRSRQSQLWRRWNSVRGRLMKRWVLIFPLPDRNL